MLDDVVKSNYVACSDIRLFTKASLMVLVQNLNLKILCNNDRTEGC